MLYNGLLVGLLVLVASVQIECKGSFQTYNNEARELYRLKNLDKLNEINSVDSHWKGDSLKTKEIPVQPKRYDPTWDSLDARPLPTWYDQNKIGIFIHWGVYSVPGVASEWFWKQWQNGNNETTRFMEDNFKPNATYQEFASQFTAEFYDPVQWAQLFKKSGARYIVLTSKHHEGYTLWPSRYSFSWNSQDVGPHRNLLGDLATAIRNQTDLKFGLYHSLYEWFNPLWVHDTENNLTTDEFVRFKTLPELYELVNTYEPEIVWSDGEWEAPDDYWKSKEFLAWLYNDSPVRDTVVTNDRWGHETLCTHGGYYTCADRYNPGVLQPHKWENCMTLDLESWGYRRNAKIEDYLTPEDLMRTIVETVSCGGNVLVNVGPTREGIIPVIQQERLEQMGEWLDVNGPAIYNTIPYTFQNDTVTPGVWYTMSADESQAYAMITSWPGSSITLGAITPSAGSTIKMLGSEAVLSWTQTSDGVVIQLPRPDTIKSQWVWTLVIS